MEVFLLLLNAKLLIIVEWEVHKKSLDTMWSEVSMNGPTEHPSRHSHYSYWNQTRPSLNNNVQVKISMIYFVH